jgi:two-component system cell cycle sensor histidine kinase/response regulator CckA
MAVILLVDDERGIVKLMSAVLAQAGHQALTASNGLEALAVYRSYSELIELVITDLKMPVMDGYELIGRIRETNPGAKIICMSGYLEEDCPKGAKFLRKPFRPDDVRAAVQEALG